MNKTVTQDLLSLPIDQYSRQMWAYQFINQLRVGKKSTILDVGGYKGKTELFHPQDKVTVCDLFDVEEPNYIKGDGRKLPFKDESQDFVVCFDTYEHIPREGREDFVSELLRVSKKGVIIAAPFDNNEGSVFQAEVNLNNYYRDLYGKDHQWLKEHIDYRIPAREELEAMLKKFKMHFVRLASNDLNIWVLMQTIYFSIELDSDLSGRVDNINRYYNRELVNLDIASENQAYRQIYFISKDSKNTQKIESFIEQEKNASDKHKKTHFIAYALSVFGVKYRDVVNHDSYLEGEVKRLNKDSQKLFHRIDKLESALRIRAASLPKKVLIKAKKTARTIRRGL